MQLTRLAGACLCAAALAPTGAVSQDATWRQDGFGSFFTSASSWTPNVVPRGTATFGPSVQTQVFFAGQTNSAVGAFVFTPDAPAYTFNPGITFTFHFQSQVVLNGAGIINNSANAPTFLNPFGSVSFANGAQAGNAVFNVSCFTVGQFCGLLEFNDTSSAANARITNTSLVRFSGSATAGNATIVTNAGGFTLFQDGATGGNATIITNYQGGTSFVGASAGNSTLTVNQGTVSFESGTAANASIANTGGVIAFRGSATAGNANIVSTGGRITFEGFSTAGNAIIAAKGNALISFTDNAQGGQARLIVDGTSAVTFGSILAVGSIEGAGLFVVDAPAQNEIVVGTNNLSTVVTGTITSSRPSATLIKIGSGTLTLLGTNTLTSLFISGGAVATNRDAGLGSANGSLVFGAGTLQLLSSFDLSPARAITLASGNGTIDTNGFNMTIAHGIAGGSGLLKTGLGTLTLAGDSTFKGGAFVFGGSLVLNGSLASGVTVAGPGSLVVNGTVASDVVNAGMTTVNGLISGNVNNNAGSLLVNGTVASDVVNAGTTTVNGRIGGNVNNNAGSLLVNGTVAGDVVNAGTTTVNGRIGGNVTNSGLLGGTGMISGSVANSGTLAPGNSIGTLTVSGNLTHNAGGTYQVETNAAGQSDRLTVGGAADAPGRHGRRPAAGRHLRATHDLHHPQRRRRGERRLRRRSNDPYPFLRSSLSYDANNVYLTLQIGGFAAAAQTPVQQAVGARARRQCRHRQRRLRHRARHHGDLHLGPGPGGA